MPGPLAWVVAATFFHFASLYYLVPTLPLYVQLLGGSTYEIGLITGVFSIASLLVRPLFGVWIDRAGRRLFLFAGAGIYVVASLGYMAIRSVPGLLLWRAFHAMGLATFSTAAASLAADLSQPGRRGTTMGIFGLAQAGALTVGPGVGRALSTAVGYPGLFLATAGTSLASLMCAAAVPRDFFQNSRRDKARRSVGRSVWDAAAVPATVQFAASVAYGTIISFTAVIARERGLETVGLFFAFLALGGLGVRLVAGKAYDAWGAPTVLTPTFLTLATGMGLLAVARAPAPFLLAGLLAGLGIGAAHTTLVTRVVNQSADEHRSSSVAGFIACWELGVGGGAIVVGGLANAMSLYTMLLVVAALPLLGLGSLPWLYDRDR
jgi:predicted MFS family arabinose efflux permease